MGKRPIAWKISIFFYIISFLFFQFANSTNDKMVKEDIYLYSFYTDTHKIFKDKYFLPSIKDDYKIVIKYVTEQVCQSGSYMKKDWNLAMIEKVNLILDAITQNWNKFFIYSDVDIQFIRPTKNKIISLIKNYDMLIQRNIHNKKNLCAGFMVIRANRKTYNLWKKIKRLLQTNKAKDDQQPLNNLLVGSNFFKIKWDLLPIEFYCPGKRWSPGQKLNIPKNILIHHANWTIGVENKIKQLKYVKKLTSHIK